ncbi:GPI transamidase component Gpi16 subunit family protein isoform 4 [Hibiscus syriacus]|uniref:GPI transamidase component Gpi16 subunit family protein isoform 4 n=1 Tax=Hibiscus syriacus TaxID=106335 RepID=A0A6A2YA66_HIBSY|nr:GPI transamidase component Gpi16 subunit family protein isoform 4 [Hibiscus syriacus]
MFYLGGFIVGGRLSADSSALCSGSKWHVRLVGRSGGPNVTSRIGSDYPYRSVGLQEMKMLYARQGSESDEKSAMLLKAQADFLESSTSYYAPEWSFPPASGNLRYGTLPREAVCTENITPWLKLLPCQDKAGISTLLDRPSIYRGFYLSQRLHLTLTGSGYEGMDLSIILEKTLTVVLQPNSQRASLVRDSEKHIQPSWSLSSIFGNQVGGKCVLAETSNVYLLLDRDRIFIEESSLLSKNSSVLYKFEVEKYSESEPFDLGLTWKILVVWLCQQAPLHASRFLMGSGNERGAIAISLKSTQTTEGFMGAHSNDERCELRVDVFQVVPWYVKVYFHSLQVFVDQQPKAVSDIIEKIHVSPSKDKVSPGVMELVLKLPCSVSSTALTIEFDKGFLHIDEYPPDANQVFDIPSTIVSFPNFHASMVFLENHSLNKSPLLSKFQEKSHVMSYTEVLLVPLTTPDFSMPYNVITITCTVFALYFGSLLNALRTRVTEEESFLKDKGSIIFIIFIHHPTISEEFWFERKLKGDHNQPPQTKFVMVCCQENWSATSAAVKVVGKDNR